MANNYECATCAAWKPAHGSREKSHIAGECHLYPPHTANHPSARWPPTYHDDWCMQWQPDKQSVMERVNKLLEEA